jgi:hypothetical protein
LVGIGRSRQDDDVDHLSTEQLMAGVDEIRRSPSDHGTLELIVRRPAVDEREVLEVGELDLDEGLVGDTWKQRGSRKTEDGSAHPEMQLNIMNARAAALVAGERERWPLAGDQLYVDLDLGGQNLPPGTRLAICDAVIEVTAEPHTGCVKFASRFGRDAHKLVWSEQGRQARLRGLYARVVVPGVIRPGDTIRVLGTADADAVEATRRNAEQNTTSR